MYCNLSTGLLTVLSATMHGSGRPPSERRKWEPEDAVFVAGENMAKITKDGRIGLSRAGTKALCKSGKTVELYFAKTTDTFAALASRWGMAASVLLEMNRVDSVMNFWSLDCPAGTFP